MHCRIRFDLQLLNGSWYFAQYSNFSVGNLSTNYMLQIGGYSGNLYDAMAYHNGQPFSTYDKENESPYPCARQYYGGFWFLSCARAYITTSPANFVFYWYADGNYKDLNVVEVNLSEDLGDQLEPKAFSKRIFRFELQRYNNNIL